MKLSIFLNFNVINTRKLSTSKSNLRRPKAYVTHKYSRISPSRANIIQKASNFEWQDQYRMYKLQQNKKLEKLEKLENNFLKKNCDINDKKVFEQESLLPEYINICFIKSNIAQLYFIIFQINFL